MAEDNTPFFFVKSINKSFDDLMTEANQKNYNPFLTNKSFGMFYDSVFFANEMNKASTLPVRMQYDFYRIGLSKRNRYFGKWPKRDIDEKIQAISKYYNISYVKAEDAYKILSANKLSEIINSYDNNDNELEIESNEK